MKPGDLVVIEGNTSPIYPDECDDCGPTGGCIGYAPHGTLGIFLESRRARVAVAGNVMFCRVIIADHGPVWVRTVWVRGVSNEAR